MVDLSQYDREEIAKVIPEAIDYLHSIRHDPDFGKRWDTFMLNYIKTLPFEFQMIALNDMYKIDIWVAAYAGEDAFRFYLSLLRRMVDLRPKIEQDLVTDLIEYYESGFFLKDLLAKEKDPQLPTSKLALQKLIDKYTGK
jgi:hypothetical protein